MVFYEVGVVFYIDSVIHRRKAEYKNEKHSRKIIVNVSPSLIYMEYLAWCRQQTRKSYMRCRTTSMSWSVWSRDTCFFVYYQSGEIKLNIDL